MHVQKHLHKHTRTRLSSPCKRMVLCRTVIPSNVGKAPSWKPCRSLHTDADNGANHAFTTNGAKLMFEPSLSTVLVILPFRDTDFVPSFPFSVAELDLLEICLFYISLGVTFQQHGLDDFELLHARIGLEFR
jgi:hypothetical protein